MTRASTGTRPDRRHALLAASATAVALAAADTYVVVLALTDMMAGVGIGIDALQRATPIISGFLLGYVVVLPLIGRLSDLVDRRAVILGCLVVFAIGSAMTALAVELPVLVAGRVLQGIGGGGLVPATLALVADLWPPGRRGLPLGVVGGVQELGAVLGPVLGAVVLAWSGWRAIFWLNAVLGVLLLVVIRVLPGAPPRAPGGRRGVPWAAVVGGLGVALGGLALAAPESLVTDVTLGVPFIPLAGDSRVVTPIGLGALLLLGAAAAGTAPRWWPVLRRSDLPGTVLVATALGALVLTFASADPEREVVGPLGLALLPVGAVALVLLAWWHRRAAEPLVPRGTVGRRGAVALLVSLLTGAALVAVVVDVPLLARLGEGYDATAGALVLVRFLVAVPVGALLGGWALRRLGDGVVAGSGLAAAAVGLLVMSGWTPAAVDDVVGSTAVLALVGFGLGAALAPVNDAVLADAPERAHGVASALVVVARMVGMIAGLALLTSVGLHRFHEAVRALPDPFDAAAVVGAGVVQVQTVFLGGALAALAASVLCLSLRLRPVARVPEPAPDPAPARRG